MNVLLGTGTICGAKLSPSNGVNKPGGAELIGSQDILDKNADWSRKRILSIVLYHDAVRDKMRKKAVQIVLGPFVAVVAIDPQESKGVIKRFSDVRVE
jgi:hypothetical protein